MQAQKSTLFRTSQHLKKSVKKTDKKSIARTFIFLLYLASFPAKYKLIDYKAHIHMIDYESLHI